MDRGVPTEEMLAEMRAADPPVLNLRDKMAGLVAGAGSGLCDIFNAQGLEPRISAP
jgi:hypothetical protein